MSILVAYLLGIVSAILPKRVHGQNEKNETNAGGSKPQPTTDPERISVEINLSPEEAKRYYCEENKSYKLHRRTFWVNVFTLLVLALYTLFTYRILCATHKSAETAAKELELSQRPWIGNPAVTPAGPVIFNSDGISPIEFEFKFSNSGNSPAVSIRYRSEINIAGIGNAGRTIAARERICKQAVEDSFAMEVYQDTMFPRDTWEPIIGAQIGGEDQVELRKEREADLRLITCVAYRPSFNDDIAYFTGTIYNLGKNFTKPRGFLPGDNIPPEKLLIERWQFGSATIIGTMKRSQTK